MKATKDSQAPEKALHAQIRDFCRARKWLYFTGSMAHRSRRTLGEPDFTILAPGKVLFIECKTATGQLSDDQKQVQREADRLGHCIHIVRSLDDFTVLLVSLGLH